MGELLQYEVPAPDQRQLPCLCGHQAQYRELRSKPVLTVVGWVEILRPYYLCSHCHQGQFPADGELDVKGKQVSPGVRRMLTVVGAAAPFDHGREQMEVLAGLQVTTKAVEPAPPRRSATTSRRASSGRSKPGRRTYRWQEASPFPSCMCKWTRRGCRPACGQTWVLPGRPTVSFLTTQSGLFWTVRAANAVLALRCCQLNGRFEDYWEARRA